MLDDRSVEAVLIGRMRWIAENHDVVLLTTRRICIRGNAHNDGQFISPSILRLFDEQDAPHIEPDGVILCS